MTIPFPTRLHLRVVLILLLLLPLVLWQTGIWTQRVVIDQIRESSLDILNFYTFQVRSELDRFDLLPRVLANDNEIIQLLSNPWDEQKVVRVNRHLEEINKVADASDVYVMDNSGLTIAASNWNKPLSFIGRNFDYRPYFQAAVRGEIGRYFALGTTSNERGYYFAVPVRRDGEVRGVVAVKMGVDRFETPEAWGADRVIITDTLGVIFISSDPAWQFKTIHPLDAWTLRAVSESLQYSDAVLSPLPIVAERRVGERGKVLGIKERVQSQPDMAAEEAFVTREYLVQSAVMPEVGWEIYVFSDMGPVTRAVTLALAFAVLIFVVVILAASYLAQRRAAIQERLAAQAELEMKVEERTAELRLSNERLQCEIVERKRTENELIQAAKLAALGQMSAGIVHELSQPLAAIRSYADNARLFLEREHYAPARSNLGMIAELTERIAKMTTHLKTFARKAPGRVEPVSLGSVLAYALALVEPQIKRGAVEVVQDLPKEDVLVMGDSIRLEQVVVNLLKNALEAMQAQERPRTLYLGLAGHAGHAVLTVRDTGPGIAEADLSQVFDPFFTTKEVGEGLGLGLSISYKIIQEFGGSMGAGNHEGGGAIFTVTLQRADTARKGS